MARDTDFAAILAQAPTGRKDIVDMTPITTALPAGYLTVVGDKGPWVALKRRPSFIHMEFFSDDAGAATVAVDVQTHPDEIAYVPNAYLSQNLSLGAAGSVGEGITPDTAACYVRLRLTAISGTNAKVGGTLSGAQL